jgi:hypothetical protein
VKPNIATGTQSTETADCEAGEHLVGGAADEVLDGAAASGWRASANNETGFTRDFVVVALSAKA